MASVSRATDVIRSPNNSVFDGTLFLCSEQFLIHPVISKSRLVFLLNISMARFKKKSMVWPMFADKKIKNNHWTWDPYPHRLTRSPLPNQAVKHLATAGRHGGRARERQVPRELRSGGGGQRVPAWATPSPTTPGTSRLHLRPLAVVGTQQSAPRQRRVHWAREAPPHDARSRAAGPSPSGTTTIGIGTREC
jgi:hypothetical protein